MTIALALPPKESIKADTFVQPITIPSTPGKGEKKCGYEVSDSTLQLIVAVGGLMVPLRFPVRRFGELTKAERETVANREQAILKEAFRLSGEDPQVGMELAVFGVFRFGMKFKALTWLVEALGDSGKIRALVCKAYATADPHN